MNDYSNSNSVLGEYDPEVDAAFVRRIDMKDAYDEGISIGEKNGTNKRNYEIAKNLLKEKLNVDLISRATGLSASEIKSIRI